MDSEVLRVVVGIILFLVLAVAGVRGVPFVGFAMAALGVALSFEAIRALDYAEPLYQWKCDEACFGPEREGWQFTRDAWQWDGLWIAAVAGTIAVWLSAGIAVAAGAVGLRSLASRGAACRIYLLAALAMAVGTLSFGAFTVIVAPLGDRYGI